VRDQLDNRKAGWAMKVKTIKGSEINLVPGVRLEGEMLRDLDLRGIDLANSVLTKCFFNESLLSDSNLRNCDLSGAVFYRTDLSGADLSGAILNDCYWNEVRFSKSTIWPSGFQPPERPDCLEDVIIAEQSTRYESGLCVMREIGIRGLHAEIRPLREFSTGYKVGPITSAEDKKGMLLRLAQIMTTGYLSYFASEVDGSSIFLEYTEDSSEAEDLFNRSVIFTHIVLMLRFLGIQFHEVKEDGTVLVSFEIENNVGEFLDKDLLAIFEIAARRAVAFGEVDLYGDDEAEIYDLEDDLSSLRKLVNKTRKNKQFKERIQQISGNQRAFQASYSMDFAEFNDPDEAGFVSLIDYAGPVSYTCEEKLILGMVAYTNYSSEGQTLSDLFEADNDGEFESNDEDDDLLDEDDDEFLDEDDEDEEEESIATIDCNFHRLAIRLLGIVFIEEGASGQFKATLRPQMSLSKVFKDLGYEVDADFEVEDEDFVFYTSLGIFDQVFEF
jgi:hypothetical protein